MPLRLGRGERAATGGRPYSNVGVIINWLVAGGNHLADAETQFAAALKTGHERPFVRELQLAASFTPLW
jgi:hypothetical protein